MEHVVDPETGALVGDRDMAYLDPVLATREAWVAVADTYDPHMLFPLWGWTAQVVRLAACSGIDVSEVVASVSYAMAVGFRCCGGAPSTGSVKEAYDELPEHVDWRDFQQAVEEVAMAWEDAV